MKGGDGEELNQSITNPHQATPGQEEADPSAGLTLPFEVALGSG